MWLADYWADFGVGRGGRGHPFPFDILYYFSRIPSQKKKVFRIELLSVPATPFLIFWFRPWLVKALYCFEFCLVICYEFWSGVCSSVLFLNWLIAINFARGSFECQLTKFFELWLADRFEVWMSRTLIGLPLSILIGWFDLSFHWLTTYCSDCWSLSFWAELVKAWLALTIG